MQIPQYTRGIIKQREVASPFNPQAIDNARINYAQPLAAAAEFADKFAVAEETTAVNEAVIRKQKDDIDFIQAKQTEWQDKPAGYSKAIETELSKRNEQYMAALPTARAKETFRQTAMRIDLGTYEQATRWEKTRGVEKLSNGIKSTIEDQKTIAYRSGQEGQSFEQIKNNFQATLIPAQSIYAADVFEGMKEEEFRGIAKNYVAGMIETNPNLAISTLSSKSLDGVLTTEDIVVLSSAAEKARQDKAKAEVKAMPLADKSALLNNPVSSEQLALDVIMGNEGIAPVAKDGAKGNPAMGGINKAAYPKEYEEAKKIYEEKGDAASKAYARDFYKREIYDKNKIAELPANVQAIVADGLTNHWSGFQTKLLQAARNGATPDQLIEMRRGEYERLAGTESVQGVREKFPYRKDLASWMKRLDKLPRGATGTAFDYLSPEDRADEIAKMREYQALGTLPNPASKTHQELVDGIYMESGLTQGLQAGDGDAINKAIGITAKYKMIPKTMQVALGGMIASGEEQPRIIAYDIIGRLAQDNPVVLSGVNGIQDDMLKEAQSYNGMVASGMPIKDALRRIDESRLPANKEAAEVRRTEFNKLAKEITPSTLAAEFDEGIFSSEPSLVGANAENLLYQYKSLLRENYALFGDMEGAKKAALSSMKHIAASEVTGKKQLMPFAPEKYYGSTDEDFFDADVLAKEIGDQLYEDVAPLIGGKNYSVVTNPANAKFAALPLANALNVAAAKMGIGDKGVELAKEKDDFLKSLVLVPTVNSSARVRQGKKPVYQVWYPDANGNLDVVRGEDNTPLFFQPDEKRIAAKYEAAKSSYKQEEIKKLQRLKDIRGGYYGDAL